MPQNPFYKTKKWQDKRDSILKRDKYLCQHCKRYGREVEATTVHHIKHRDKYPELAYDSDNLVSLCYKCHAKQHPEKGAKPKSYYPPRKR